MSGPGIFFDEDSKQDAVPRNFALAPPKPETGFLDNFRASYSATVAGGRTDSGEITLKDAYQPVIDALNKDYRKADWRKGWLVSPDADKFFRNPYVGRAPNPAFDEAGGVPADEERIWGEISRRRATDSTFLQHLGGDRDEFVRGLNARSRAALDREAATRDRASTSGTIGGFVGTMAGGFSDPVNLATIMLGAGPAKSILQAAVREGAMNMAVEAVSTPLVAARRKEIDRPMSLSDMVEGVAAAGVLGGALGGGTKAAKRGLEYLRKGGKVEDLGEDELVTLVRDMGETSPEVQNARRVLEQKLDVERTNPGDDTPQGQVEHAERLQAATEQVADGSALRAPRAPLTARERLATFSDSAGEGQRRQIDALMHDIKAAREPVEAPPAPDTLSPLPDGPQAPLATRTAAPPRGPSALPSDVVSFLRGKGYADAQARGIAAGIVAESRADHRIINPTSGAFGLGQWLGPRKAELFRRYGSNPSRKQQMEFMHWELQGGDFGGEAVLATKDEGAALNAYIKKFMRPAKGAETSGDLKRGFAALGRGNELAPMGQAAPGQRASPAPPEPLKVALSEEIIDGERAPVIRSLDEVLGELDGDDAFISAVEACL